MQHTLHQTLLVLNQKLNGTWHLHGGSSCFIRKKKVLQAKQKVMVLVLTEEADLVLKDLGGRGSKQPILSSVYVE